MLLSLAADGADMVNSDTDGSGRVNEFQETVRGYESRKRIEVEELPPAPKIAGAGQ